MADRRVALIKKLGLKPPYSISTVRAAYKIQAAKLHPDKNPDTDSSDAFKAMNEDFRELLALLKSTAKKTPVAAKSSSAATKSSAAQKKAKPLSKEDTQLNKKRLDESYAQTAKQDYSEVGPHKGEQEPSTNTPTAESSDAQEEAIEVIKHPAPCCCRCKLTSSTLAHRRIRRVISMLFTYRSKDLEGVMCKPCCIRASLWANTLNFFLGWWSAMGFIANLRAMASNSKGGFCDHEKNALLHYRVANYEINQHKFTRALALLLDAKRLSEDENLLKRIERLIHKLGSASSLSADQQDDKPLSYILPHIALLLSLIIAVASGAYFTLKLINTPPPKPILSLSLAQVPDYHRPVYRQQRLGEHYTLGLVAIYRETDSSSGVVAKLPPFSPIEVTKVLEGGWLELSYQGNSAFVEEALIGFGEAVTARKQNCTSYPGSRPFHAEFLGGDTGAGVLRLVNAQKLDASLKFMSARKKVVMHIYMHGESEMQLNNLPGGIAQVEISHGRFYNQACTSFTAELSQRMQKMTMMFGTSQKIEF